MTFMHVGLALGGLACVSIPIIIHLLMRRRRKPIMWGAMRFLQEAYRRQRRRLIIEKWLLLATRCAIIALVALAIGRPLLGSLGVGAGERTVYLIIDNGLCSALRDSDDRPALDRHKEAARGILEAIDDVGTDGTRVGLITMGTPAEGLITPPSSDLNAVRAVIGELEPTDAATDLGGALRELETAISGPADGERSDGDEKVDAIILSDFRAGSVDPSKALTAVGDRVRLLASEAAIESAGNVSLAAVEPLRSVVVTGEAGEGIAGEQVRIELVRTGAAIGQAGLSTVRVRVHAPGGAGNERRETVRWASGQQTATTTVQIGGREASGSSRRLSDSAVIVASIDDDRLRADNTWRRPVEIRQSLRVGIVSPRRFGRRVRVDELDAGSWIRLAMRPDAGAGVEVSEIEPGSLDRAQLATLDGLVLPRPDLIDDASWRRIALFLERGGLLLVCPPPDATVHLWPDAMTSALGLDWTIQREATRFDDPAGVVLSPVGDSPTLLTLIQGEVEELVRPVNVFRVLQSEMSPGSGRALLSLDDGTPLLWATTSEDRSKRGLIVYLACALDLDWTDLPTKPLMVPLMQEVLRQGIGSARGTWQAIAGARPPVPDRTIEINPASWDELDAGAEDLFVVNENGVASAPARRSGVWEATDERGGRRGVIAINPDTPAGDAGTQDSDAIATWLSGANGGEPVRLLATDDAGSTRPSAAKYFGSELDRRSVSLPLLIAALLLAIFEVVLARMASHASLSSAGSTRLSGSAT